MRECLSVLPLSNIHTEKFFMRILKSSIQKLCFITLLLVILFVSLWFPQQSEAQSVVSVSLSQVQCNTTGTVSAQSKFRRHDKRHQRHHKRHQKASFDNRQIVTPTPSPNPCPTTSSSPSSQPIALVYHDASTDCCAQALATMIQNDTKWHFKVLLVGPSERTSVQAGLAMPNAKIFAEPGATGDDTTSLAAQKGNIPAIQNFVKNGGRFLGVCMGGYLAGKDEFGLFPVPANEYIDEPRASTTSTADTVIPITWHGKVRRMYFQDGPSFILTPGTTGVTVLATYSNGEAAVAVARYGKGKTAVSGPHPEADQSWYSAYSLPYPGSTQDLGDDLIDTLMQ